MSVANGGKKERREKRVEKSENGGKKEERRVKREARSERVIMEGEKREASSE